MHCQNIMHCLIIELKDSLHMWLTDAIPIGLPHIIISEKPFNFISDGNFFEWLFDSAGSVVGVELHNPPNQAMFLPLATDTGVLDCSDPPYPRFWFSAIREGTSRSLQDWEDYYYMASDGTMLIILRTHLLTQVELDTLVLSLKNR